MLVGRMLGWLLIAVALVVLGSDALRWLERGQLDLTALGELWFRLSPGSLNLVQAVIQRYLLPELWDPGLIAILTLPAVVIFGGLGILLRLLFRRRQAKRKPRFGALA